MIFSILLFLHSFSESRFSLSFLHCVLPFFLCLLDPPFSHAVSDCRVNKISEVDGKHKAEDGEDELSQSGAVNFFATNHVLLQERADQKKESLRANFNELMREVGKHVMILKQVC